MYTIWPSEKKTWGAETSRYVTPPHSCWLLVLWTVVKLLQAGRDVRRYLTVFDDRYWRLSGAAPVCGRTPCPRAPSLHNTPSSDNETQNYSNLIFTIVTIVQSTAGRSWRDELESGDESIDPHVSSLSSYQIETRRRCVQSDGFISNSIETSSEYKPFVCSHPHTHQSRKRRKIGL